MDIPLPTSLSDVIADGILAQSSIDRAFAAKLGRINGVEFSLPEEASEAQVRINRASGAPLDTTGTVIAWVRGNELEWVSSRGEAFNIPELRGTQRFNDDLITAARTLHGNAPAFIAPFGARGNALVAINEVPELFDAKTDLIEGLPRLGSSIDLVRAASAYAGFRGLGIRVEDHRISYSDGTSLMLRDGHPVEISGGMSLKDVRADAALFGAEHQLLFDAISPNHQIHYSIRSATALIDNQFEVQATPLAVIEGGTWRWAWADKRFDGRGVEGLARFGFDNGLLPLTSPEISVDVAKELELINVAKPVLQIWTHVTVTSEEGVKVVLLLKHPRLQLPPATFAAVEATLYSPLAPDLDARRAVAAYASQRDVPFDGTSITVENRHINITFDGDRISSIN